MQLQHSRQLCFLEPAGACDAMVFAQALEGGRALLQELATPTAPAQGWLPALWEWRVPRWRHQCWVALLMFLQVERRLPPMPQAPEE
jgi:hypothetical protein